jgi:hypothetical protein
MSMIGRFSLVPPDDIARMLHDSAAVAATLDEGSSFVDDGARAGKGMLVYLS